jgi:D-alanyl-lipoteichoic acid acyltransferase DltB (MBOAT superfamily)
MLFHSQTFLLVFLPFVVCSTYVLAHRRTARESFLVAASVFFYACWDWRYVPLLVGLASATWICARLFLARPQGRDWLLGLGVALNLGALVLFKYADFLGGAIGGDAWTPWRLALPLGISFFVFQKIAYLIDLRRGDRHHYGLLEFSLFVSFFPQLIAGPLVRHNEIIGQFGRDPTAGGAMWENLSRGLVLFVIGMGKKLAIADTLSPNADRLFALANGGAPNLAEAWAGVATYALQIYFDFSGYSDMAIGLALMLGIRLPINFNAPYRAISIRDFWRRWHITLSRFLRDYLYIPLGGNRNGAARQAVNVVTTMLLGGLWHGASWNFVVWGGLHGLALAVDGAWRRLGLRLPALVGWLVTLVFVVVAWAPFRAPSLMAAEHMLAGLAGAGGWGGVVLRNGLLLPVAAGLAIIGPTSLDIALGRLRPNAWLAASAGTVLAVLAFLSGGRLHDAFIYFQF